MDFLVALRMGVRLASQTRCLLFFVCVDQMSASFVCYLEIMSMLAPYCIISENRGKKGATSSSITVFTSMNFHHHQQQHVVLQSSSYFHQY